MKRITFSILFLFLCIGSKNIFASEKLSLKFFGPEFNFYVEIDQNALLLESNSLNLKLKKRRCNRYLFSYTREILREILAGSTDQKVNSEKDTSVKIISSDKIQNIPYVSRSSRLLSKFMSRVVSLSYEEEYACRK